MFLPPNLYHSGKTKKLFKAAAYPWSNAVIGREGGGGCNTKIFRKELHVTKTFFFRIGVYQPLRCFIIVNPENITNWNNFVILIDKTTT